MKTYQPKASEVKRSWHLIDADGVILGRMATEVARLLTGKNKPSFSRHMDMGDYVVVVNAEKVKLSGKKTKQKVYRSHSGYPGGFKEVTFAQMRRNTPKESLATPLPECFPTTDLKKTEWLG